MAIAKGKLYMIPQPLGDTSSLEHLSPLVRQTILQLDYFIVENEKAARRFLKRICPEKPQSELKLQSLNKFTEPHEIGTMLDPCLAGNSMGMISDAGCPGIADPGAEIAAKAHENGVKVVPLVGPSSILLALMGSGLNGQSFTFHGYLPIDKRQRQRAIRRMEKDSEDSNQTQLFIETPYRNNVMLDSLIQALHPSTRLCVACDLNMDSEYIETKPVAQWRKNKPNLHKRPCIFLFQKDRSF